jgi:hypothetical protein
MNYKIIISKVEDNTEYNLTKFKFIFLGRFMKFPKYYFSVILGHHYTFFFKHHKHAHTYTYISNFKPLNILPKY